MEIFERLQKRTGENDLDLLADLLDSAESVILARRFPFGGGELEERYRDLQFRIALAMYNKLGAEYETSHSESGISRTWGSARRAIRSSGSSTIRCRSIGSPLIWGSARTRRSLQPNAGAKRPSMISTCQEETNPF